MIVVTRCQILRLKCTKFDFGWRSAPDPTGGAYSASPDPLSGFKGPTSKGREGKVGEGEWRKGEKEGKRRNLLQDLREINAPENIYLSIQQK